jgi:hypothetical protein
MEARSISRKTGPNILMIKNPEATISKSIIKRLTMYLGKVFNPVAHFLIKSLNVV